MRTIVGITCGILVVLFAQPSSALVHIWSQRIGGANANSVSSVAMDGAGNVLVMGSFHGTANFGGSDLVSEGISDIFVAKYDANGAHQWSRRVGGPGNENGFGIAVDMQGNVVITDLVNVNEGYDDMFLAKFDANGVHLWSKRFGDLDNDIGYAVAVDDLGNVVMTGGFWGSVDFGGGMIQASGVDMFLVKYDANGVHQWSRGAGGLFVHDWGHGLAVDGSENVFVTGEFSGRANFGGEDLMSAGAQDIFLAKYDANGAHQWSQSFGGTSVDNGSGVAVDGPGNVALTGMFSKTVDFGGGSMTGAGLGDVFLVQFDANGVHRWSQRFGSASDELGQAVAVHGSGTVMVGNFNGTINFGGADLVAEESYDAFMTKFGEAPVPALISRFDAVARARRVELTWTLSGEQLPEAFHLYRASDYTSPVLLMSGDARKVHSYVDESVVAGITYRYELVFRAANGDEFRSQIASVSLPALALVLHQNVPNPFNPQTAIGYDLPSSMRVRLTIVDVAGRLVRTLVDEQQTAGSREAIWTGRDDMGNPVPSGVYFYVLEAGKERLTRKLVLLK